MLSCFRWLSSLLTSSESQSWQELLAFELSVFVLVSLCLQHCADELNGPCRAGETATGCHRKSIPEIMEGGTEKQSTTVCRGTATFSPLCALWFHSLYSRSLELWALALNLQYFCPEHFKVVYKLFASTKLYRCKACEFGQFTPS